MHLHRADVVVIDGMSFSSMHPYRASRRLYRRRRRDFNSVAHSRLRFGGVERNSEAMLATSI